MRGYYVYIVIAVLIMAVMAVVFYSLSIGYDASTIFPSHDKTLLVGKDNSILN